MNNENRGMSQSDNFEFRLESLLTKGEQFYLITHAPNEIDDESPASKVAELLSKSEEEFVKEYGGYDENKRKEIYCLILHEVHEAFLSNEVKYFQKLGDLTELINGLEEMKELRDYFDSTEHPFRETNAIILACKYGKEEIIKCLFSNEGKLIKNISIYNGIESLNPTDIDSECHNCFYYAIRSNSVRLLKELINEWPGDYFYSHLEDLDPILSKAYEELMLKNILLSAEMKYYVENKLIDLRFYGDESHLDVDPLKHVENITHRIDLVVECIEILAKVYSNDTKVDKQFLIMIKFIASNIHILKQQLRCTYDKLPWEEIEFCLVCFLLSRTTKKEINLYFRHVLKKEKLVTQLLSFSKCLKSERCTINFSDVETLNKSVELQRSKVIADIVSKCPSFIELYEDYELIRDIYSLEKMRTYIGLAVSADCSENEGQLVVARALQVIDEHLKNTLESPKLSNFTRERLLQTVPRITREVIKNLRYSLLHAVLHLKITGNDGEVFENIQNVIKNIGAVISINLYEIKTNVIRTILEKFIERDGLETMKEIIEVFRYIEFEEISLQRFEQTQKYEFVSEIYYKLRDANKNNFIKGDFDAIFNKIKKQFITEKENRERLITGYKRGFLTIMYISEKINESKLNFPTLKAYKTQAFKALQRIPPRVKSNTVEDIIQALSDKLYSYLLIKHHSIIIEIYGEELIECYESITSSEDCKISYSTGCIIDFVFKICIPKMNREKHCDIIILLFGYSKGLILKNETMKCEEIFREELEVKYASQMNMKTGNVDEDKCNTQLKQNFLQLENILSSKRLSAESFKNITSSISNKYLLAALEMLLLDILSLLESSTQLLPVNKSFLDCHSPLLIGECLSNHLAHGNALMDVLYSDPTTAIISNALKLISENVNEKNIKIGKLVNKDLSGLKDRLEQDLEVIFNQERMFSAFEEGNYEGFMNCIKKGADIWSRSHSLWTSLHFAAKGKGKVKFKYQKKIFKFVLGQNLDVNAKDINRQSLLHVAATFGRKDIVKYIIRKTKIDFNERDIFGKTPLDVAAQYGHKGVVKLLLKHTPKTSFEDIRKHGSPLFHAVRNNQYDVAVFLLERETNVDAYHCRGGYTLLFVASERGCLELVNYLLERNADPDPTDPVEQTPLHLAALNGHLEVVKALVSHRADVNAKCLQGLTPLHNAVISGLEETVKILLEKEANVADVFDRLIIMYVSDHYRGIFDTAPIFGFKVKDNKSQVKKDKANDEGITALHVAAWSGHKGIVELLLKHGARVNVRDLKGQTALHVSSLYKHKDIVSLLLEKGAMINAKDKEGKNSLHNASECGCKEVVEILASEGVEINAKDINGQTPLHVGAFNGHKAVLEVLFEKEALIESKDKGGSTPLHLAVQVKGNETAVKYLLSKGADVNAKDCNGWTPLHYASSNGNPKVIKLLYEAEADVNLVDTDQRTSLHIAAWKNHIEIVESLSSIKDINLNCYDWRGYTPLNDAVSCNNEECFHILISKGANVNAGICLECAILSGNKRIVDELLQHKRSATITCDEYTNLLNIASLREEAAILETLLTKVNHIYVPTIEIEKLILDAINCGKANIVGVLLKRGRKFLLDFNWEKWLNLAAKEGQNAVVQVLLHYKANMNNVDSYIITSLQWAVICNHKNVVKTLLHYNETNIHIKDENGCNLLHLAAEGGHLDMVIWLSKKGVDSKWQDIKGSKPIHTAAKKGHIDIVQFFLDNGIDINDRGVEDASLLHYAAQGDSLEVANYLIGLNFDIEAVDKNSRTSVHHASLYGNINLLTNLLSKGAIYDATDDKNRKPSDLAKCPDVSKLLVSTEKLFAAVKNNNPSEIENCVKEGAFIDARSAENSTFLYYEAWKGYHNVLRIVLKNKENPNFIRKDGCTPMHFAAKFGHFGIVKALLLNGATYNIASNEGKTPLDFAEDENITNLLKLVDNSFKGVEKGNSNVIEDLKKVHDVEEVMAVLNCCNRNGSSLVVHAIRNDFPEIEKLKQLLQGYVSWQIDIAHKKFKLGHFDESNTIYKLVLQKRTSIFGANNPATLEIRVKMAKILYCQNNFEDTLNILKDIYMKQEIVLGANNKDTLFTRKFIALVLLQRGEVDDAFTIYKELFSI